VHPDYFSSAGFAFQRWQLKEMQEKNLFDFYEINENSLFIYYRTLEPDA
jgi:alpha-2-macroglobulin-like protein